MKEGRKSRREKIRKGGAGVGKGSTKEGGREEKGGAGGEGWGKKRQEGHREEERGEGGRNS